MATEVDNAGSMDGAVEALRRFLDKLTITRSTILEFAIQCLENDQMQQIGYAFMNHARDILYEDPAIRERALVEECYARTFFNFHKASLYGTEGFCRGDPAIALDLIETLESMHGIEQRGNTIHVQATAVQ